MVAGYFFFACFVLPDRYLPDRYLPDLYLPDLYIDRLFLFCHPGPTGQIPTGQIPTGLIPTGLIPRSFFLSPQGLPDSYLGQFLSPQAYRTYTLVNCCHPMVTGLIPRSFFVTPGLAHLYLGQFLLPRPTGLMHRSVFVTPGLPDYIYLLLVI
jgi:hypothetical protein